MDRQELERIAKAEAGIACVGEALLIAQGVEPGKVDRTWFQPHADLLFRLEAKEQVDPAVAKSYVRLLSSGKLPQWVECCYDSRLMRAAASWAD